MTNSDVEHFFDALPALPDVVTMVAGLLGDQLEAEKNVTAASIVMTTNYNGPVAYLLEAARRMEARGSGCIVGISSVAGERGRKSNYIYGSAKAGFTAFLSGLRNRLASRGVAVITVKPGDVAQAIWAAVAGGKDVIYVRPIWRLIMLLIRIMPESLFKRSSI